MSSPNHTAAAKELADAKANFTSCQVALGKAKERVASAEANFKAASDELVDSFAPAEPQKKPATPSST